MRIPTKVYAISLGLEELAMAFSLINRPDKSRQLFNSISPRLSNEQMEARLTSASHSLAARGLVTVGPPETAKLSAELEQALLPLVKFDKVIQVSEVTAEESVFRSVHIFRNRLFTSHLIRMGVVHHLEAGDYSLLHEYLMNSFPDFGKSKLTIKIKNNHNLTLGLLGKLVKDNESPEQMSQILTEVGLPKSISEPLSVDLARQKMRAAIVVQSVNPEGNSREDKYRIDSSLFLLSGAQSDWLFEFPGAGDQIVAVIRSASRRTLAAILRRFLLL